MPRAMEVVLSAEERQRLEELSSTAPSPRVRDRARMILCVADGMSRTDVAQVFRNGRVTLYRQLLRFRECGADGLGDRPRCGPPPRLSRAQAKELCSLACQAPERHGYQTSVWTLALLQAEVEKRWGLKVSDETVRRELHKGDMKYICPKLHLHSPDPQYAEKRGAWSA